MPDMGPTRVRARFVACTNSTLYSILNGVCVSARRVQCGLVWTPRFQIPTLNQAEVTPSVAVLRSPGLSHPKTLHDGALALTAGANSIAALGASPPSAILPPPRRQGPPTLSSHLRAALVRAKHGRPQRSHRKSDALSACASDAHAMEEAPVPAPVSGMLSWKRSTRRLRQLSSGRNEAINCASAAVVHVSRWRGTAALGKRPQPLAPSWQVHGFLQGSVSLFRSTTSFQEAFTSRSAMHCHACCVTHLRLTYPLGSQLLSVL